MANADRELVAAYDGVLNLDLPEGARAPTAYCASGWARDIVTCSSIYPLSIALDITGLGPVRCCHATTRSDTEIVFVDSTIERYRDAFIDSDEPTIGLGHTHMPFDRLADRRRFVNPGTVGMPYGARAALWAVLGPDVALRRTEYDGAVAAERFRSAAPDIPDWLNLSTRTC